MKEEDENHGDNDKETNLGENFIKTENLSDEGKLLKRFQTVIAALEIIHFLS